jgi:sugar phosphate isomerase/epimerase
MRVGVLARGEVEQLEWAHRLGFRSMEWMAFDASPAVTDHSAWESFARRIGDAAGERDVRISAIGAYYRNPLDPRQSDHARAIFERAIEIAALLGVRTVSGFAGAVIETEVDERGGNLVYRPFENYLPRLLQFWEPLADRAADKGVRIAFEHCPQGPYHLPVMHSNMLAQPAMWERLFEASRCGNLGLEWDPSHLICQFIDPVENVHKFGSRIFHVHAKDAFINQGLLRTYGICHPGVAEHRFPGLGQANWAQIVHTLLRVGYDSDLNIEGWHDPVYRDRDPHSSDAGPSGRDRARLNLEATGLMLARRTLESYVAGTE